MVWPEYFFSSATYGLSFLFFFFSLHRQVSDRAVYDFSGNHLEQTQAGAGDYSTSIHTSFRVLGSEKEKSRGGCCCRCVVPDLCKLCWQRRCDG